MLASDVLPPRTVSSRGMSAMLKRLETDSPDQYTFKLLPPSSLNSSFPRNPESKVSLARGENTRGLPRTPMRGQSGIARSGPPLSFDERGASVASGVCPGEPGETQPQPFTKISDPGSLARRENTRGLPRTPMRGQSGIARSESPLSFDERGASVASGVCPGERGGNGEAKGGHPNPSDWSWLPRSARTSPTGLAFLYTKTPGTDFKPRLAIAPPFPIQSELQTIDRDTLLQSIDPPLYVGIILIRYGYVAIAIAHDETIAVTKTDTRWVPNKHRAGGQSANRFKRSREKWAREFFDKSARLAADRFSAYPHQLHYLIFGGDKHVINQFIQRANLPDNLADRILPRRLNTLRPNRNALKDAVRQTWSSTIYELAN